MSSFFEGRVRDLSIKGTGVVEDNLNNIFFVPGVWPGDLAQFEIIKIEKRYGTAKLVKLITPSQDRLSVACPYLGINENSCQGHPWMIASYSSQLIYKEKILKYNLNRAKVDLDEKVIKPIWPSPKIFEYRNRAQLKTDGKSIGLVSKNKKIVPILDCIALSPKNRITLKELIKKLPNDRWIPGKNFEWNFIDIDEMIDHTQIVLNKRRPFAQCNTEQNEKIKDWFNNIIESLNLKQLEVLELFAGSGNFTKILSTQECRKIIAAEICREAVDQLVSINLPAVYAYDLNLYNKSSLKQLSRSVDNPHTLVLNPPRKGMPNLKFLLTIFPKIKNIIYISCNVETFARDAKNILQSSYKIKEIIPVDQFPHTPHVEILSHFALN